MMMTVCLLAAMTATTLAQDAQPTAKQGLHYDSPAMVWDEAMPLGNGLLGGLVEPAVGAPVAGGQIEDLLAAVF